MQKFLFIGMGGSGGKTLRYTWREIRRRLKEAGWEGDVPRAYRFVHIDCPEDPDIVEGDVPAQMQGAEHTYLGLGKVPRQYKAYDEALTRKSGNLTAVTGWRPDPGADIPPPYLGAGQRRSVGRIVGLSELDDIGTTLAQIVKSLAAQDVTTELQRLGVQLGASTKVSGKGVPITTIVLGSLGGGSGSGMVHDVVELLRALPESQESNLEQRIMTVLYAPDVFSHLAPADRQGIEPNTLAAISELVAGYEHEGAVNDEEAALLRHGKGAVPIQGRRTARANLIVGTRNASISYSTSHEVYRAMAKAIAQYAVDSEVRERAEKYTVNQQGHTVTSDFRVTRLSGDRPCGSIGYANVSLGASLFGEYAQERLAKRAVERLLHGHMEEADVEDPKREELLITEILKRETPGFLQACQLYEYSTDHNEILDALRVVDDVKRRIDQRINTTRRELEGREDEQSPKSWLASLTAAFDHVNSEAMHEEQSKRFERTSEWSLEIQDRVLTAVADALARFGFPVTRRLVNLLVRQLDAACEELDRDANKLDEEADSALGKVASAFTSLRGKITPQHEQFGLAAKDRAERLFKRSEAELYRSTASLVRELVKDFFTELKRSLASAEKRLRTTVKEEADLVEQWSSEAVPPHLRPAPNEILLEEHTTFPETFERLVDVQFDDGIDGALREVITGAWRWDDGSNERADDAEADADPSQTLIEPVQTWQPAILGSRRPRLKFELDPAALLERAEVWVKNCRGGEIRRAVIADLNEWLKEDQPDAAARASQFADAFELALAAAAPLVSIAPSAYEFVHGDEVPAARPVISSIPIGEDHPAYPRIAAALNGLGLSEGDVKDLFKPTVRRSAVEVSSFLPSGVHPTVFGSLMAPILADWQSRKTAQDRTQFWQWRRARRLRAFVPMSLPRQRALIRGWLTSNLLGQVDQLNGSWSSGPLTIWTPTGRRPFPEHLLGKDVAKHGAVLPALLESLPLALLVAASGNTEEVEAYVRLLDLGASGDDLDGSAEDYAEANSELIQWILDGETAQSDPTTEAAPVPPKELAGSASSGSDERRDALLAALGGYLESQREVAAQKVTLNTSRRLGRAWEMSPMAITAADQLIGAISAVEVGPVPKEVAWG